MDRFVAFIWDPRNEASSSRVDSWRHELPAHPLGWTAVVDRPGMRVIVLNKSSAGPVVADMSPLDGVVVGSLFQTGGEHAGRVRQLSPDAVRKIGHTAGANLISDFWGSYVAIWRDPTAETSYALCDPCGATACFAVRSNDVDVLCSYASDIAGLSTLKLPVDWDAVRAFLVHNYFITKHTGLSGLTEVLPGQRATWDGSGLRTEWVWDPVAIARSPSRRSFVQHQAELRAVAESCFAALGRVHRNIVVRVSGGLDSSIVLNLMRRNSDGQVRGLHMIGRGYEAYELQLARLAAKHADMQLLELEMELSTADVASLEAAPLLARPTKQLLGVTADTVLQQACEALGADTVMGGHGGDNLFLQRSVAGDTFVDFIRLNGLSGQFWKVAYDTAMLLERPVWSVLQRAGAHLLGSRKWNALAFLADDGARQERLLMAEGADQVPADYTTSPWLLEAEQLPPSKAEQLRGIVALRNYHPIVGHGVAYDAVHPFISQPLVEFALRTPAYMFTQDGIDRSLERAAFADIVPSEIRRRMNKGFINHKLTHDLANESARLREFILDGHLVSEGIVDRARTEAALSPESLLQGNGVGAMLNVLAAEAWVRPWQRRSNSAL